MIKKLDEKDFDKVFRLMEESFPKDEYRHYEEQKALLHLSAYQIYVLSNDEEDGIKAFIAIWEFDSLVFIEHFAVNSLYRNSGIGGKILEEIIRMFDKMVCLEVEMPENAIAFRRIKFYERNGFFLNEYPYMQPSLSMERNAVPLFVMTYGRAVTSEEFEKIKETLYTKVYKQITS